MPTLASSHLRNLSMAAHPQVLSILRSSHYPRPRCLVPVKAAKEATGMHMTKDNSTTLLNVANRRMQMVTAIPVAPFAEVALGTINPLSLNIVAVIASKPPQPTSPSGVHGILTKCQSPLLPLFNHRGTAITPFNLQPSCKAGSVSLPSRAHTTASPACHTTRATMQSDKERNKQRHINLQFHDKSENGEDSVSLISRFFARLPFSSFAISGVKVLRTFKFYAGC